MILVTGGTGFVGREVVAQLLALGYHVRLLTRHPQRGNSLAAHPRLQLVPGDALRPDTLPAAMTGVRAVINLIGIIAETSRVTYEQAHTQATRNLLAAAKQAGVTRWIQMSAIGTRPFARSRYHLTKWHAEELVRQSGLDWTLFRPSLIYGHDERDRLLNLLRRTLSSPINLLLVYSFPLLDGGAPLVQPVSVREVARCFALAPAKAAAIGQTYDLVGPAAFSWREMIFKILRALGRKGLYEELPLLLALRKLLWWATLLLPALLIAIRWRQTILFNIPSEPLILASEALRPFLPRQLQPGEILKMALEDNTGDPLPAMKTFAYIPETFEQGLANILL